MTTPHDGATDEALAERMLRLALAFLDGPWEEAELDQRGRIALDVNRNPELFFELRSGVHAALATYRKAPWDRPRELAATMLAALLPDPPRRLVAAVPPKPRPTFPVRELRSVADLERFTELFSTELDWYADLRGRERTVTDERLRHYRYQWRASRHRPARLIEAPKDRLRKVQRRILRDVLAPVPVGAIAHGYVRGRSVLTAADQHVGADVLIQLDLTAFFPSVTFGRVVAIFETLGYPREVARFLAGLTTNVTPRTVLQGRPVPPAGDPDQISERWHADRRLTAPHLPQGAPTSPALANLACYRFDRRLAGVARAFDATVTRYADDLTFSGGRRLRSRSRDLIRTVSEVATESGFHVAPAKTRITTAAQRQQVLGVVVNTRRTLPRRELETFEAILTNCVRTGPAPQNRDDHPDFRAHLRGRLAWTAAAAPHQAEQLRALYDRIDWD